MRFVPLKSIDQQAVLTLEKAKPGASGSRQHTTQHRVSSNGSNVD
jgi:hypothetical protein